MRGLLVVVAMLSCIVFSAMGLEVVGLGRPSSAQLELIRTLGQLVGREGSQATLYLDGFRYSAVCGESRSGRVSRVVIDDGFRVLTVVNGRLLDRRPFTIAELELAGCPRSVSRSLRVSLAHAGRLRIATGTLAGRSVELVRVREGSDRLMLYLSRSSGLPVRLALLGDRSRGVSDIAYRRRVESR